MYDEDYFLEFYSNVRLQMNSLADRVSLKINKSPASLRWTDFKSYFSDKYDIDYIEYPFKSSLRKRLSGSIKIAGDCAIIGYNGNVSPNRQRFSQAHETGHLFDSLVLNTGETQQFEDLLEKNYGESNLPDEWFANISAGMMLIEESGLLYELQQGLSFHSLCHLYSVSEGCLNIRLKQLLQYKYQTNRYYAYEAVTKYRLYSDNSDLLQCLSQVGSCVM